MTVGRSEKRVQKTHRERRLNRSLDRSGSECGSEFGSEWTGADRSGVDRSVGRGVSGSELRSWSELGSSGSELGSTGLELGSSCFVSGVEWNGASLVSGSELGSSGCVEAWADQSFRDLGCVEAWADQSFGELGCVEAWAESSACESRACAWWEQSLCVFPEINWSENNDWIQFQSFFAYFPVKLKLFSVWPNFPAQPNARFSGNWFPEIKFSRNKRSLILLLSPPHPPLLSLSFIFTFSL